MGKSSTKRPGDFGPWVYKAEGDFRTAATMVRKRKDPAPDNVCFCAHQCVEKYLKAFLVLHKTGFPKTHSLQALLDLAVDLDPAMENLRDDLVHLESFAVEVRYPGENATVRESHTAVRRMRRVRRVLREKLGLGSL